MTASSTQTATTPAAEARPLYPIGVPAKFSADGIVQRFPGNTILCHVPANSPLLSALHAVHDALRSHPTLSKQIHLLPPSSWHMTVLDGVRELECESGMWPPGREKQTLDDCTAKFTAKLRQLGRQLESEGLDPPYRMQVRGFGPTDVGIRLEIDGATAEEEERMRRLRDRLAATLGFEAPNHKTYSFHISMAYLLRHIDAEQRDELSKVFAKHLPMVQQEFELGAVEFCTYENMYHFSRLFYLGE